MSEISSGASLGNNFLLVVSKAKSDPSPLPTYQGDVLGGAVIKVPTVAL